MNNTKRIRFTLNEITALRISVEQQLKTLSAVKEPDSNLKLVIKTLETANKKLK